MIFSALIRKIVVAILLILGVISSGVVGFMLIEEMNFVDALYMTVITVSTVGFSEVKCLSQTGRLFTTGLILTNIAIFTYAVTTLSSFLLDGGVRQFLKYYAMNKKIAELSQHVVVCGFGRIGTQVCRELALEGQPFVVIEKDMSRLVALEGELPYLFVHGEAVDDHILLQARLVHARALITTLPDDADNVFVVLAAREINPSLNIVSRITHRSSESKLKRAGADYVILPELLGGIHMAALVTKPDIWQFIRLITTPGRSAHFFEDFTCTESLFGKSLRELDVRAHTGVTIVGLKYADGRFVVNPDADTVLEDKAKVIVLGDAGQLERFRAFIRQVS